MIAAVHLSRAAVALLVTGVFLTACTEPEVILPGEREAIRDDLQLQGDRPDPANNQKRAIRLPAQKANAEWPQAAASPAFRTENAALGPSPRLIWSTPIGNGDARRQRITAQPIVGGGRIYTLDSGARVSAVSTGGAVLWTTDLTPSTDKDPDATGGGMAFDKGTLYVSLGYGQLAALDAVSGAVRWRQKLEATGSGMPTVANGLVYLVAGDQTGWAVEADTGRIAWQVSGTPSVANILGAPAPALSSKYVIFGFGSGDIVAAFRKGGLRRWSGAVSGQRVGIASSRISDLTGAPVVVGNRVYAGNHSGRIVALDVDSGERIWTARTGALGPLWVTGDGAFAITDRNQLTRLNTSDGTTVWVADLPGFTSGKPRRQGSIFAHYGPILAGSRIVVASNDGYLRLFSPEDGTLTAQIEVPGGATTSPTVAGQTLYVVGSNGQLHAFR